MFFQIFYIGFELHAIPSSFCMKCNGFSDLSVKKSLVNGLSGVLLKTSSLEKDPFPQGSDVFSLSGLSMALVKSIG